MKLQFPLITSKPTATFAVMTKDLVDALLALNTKNRKKRETLVNIYRRSIGQGLWVATNQGIGVAASGFLIDGQHRLEALRASGYPAVTMLVVTGLSNEAMAAVDNGGNRTAQDYLQLLFDTKVSNQVAAILRTCMTAEDNFMSHPKYAPQEYAAALEKLGQSVNAIVSVELAHRLPAAALAALVDAHHKGYSTEAVSFTKALITGEMLQRDNPALVLRNWLASHKGGGESIMVERYRKTNRALQAWIDQRPISRLYRTKAPLTRALEAA